MHSLIEDGLRPSLSAGHSVGSLRLLLRPDQSVCGWSPNGGKRGEIMSQVEGGSMLIIGLDAGVIRETLSSVSLADIDLAISIRPVKLWFPPAEQVKEIIAPLKEGTKLVVPLKVSGAFIHA